jgi:hypothetical protein
MGNTRAVFASVGAGAALVAAAAVALLVVSAVFAFGGHAGGLRSAAERSPLVLDAAADISDHRPGFPEAAPVVLRAPVRPLARRERPARSHAMPAAVVAPQPLATVQPMVRAPAVVVAVSPRPIAPLPGSAEGLPRTGDAVRRAGIDLSSTARRTRTTLADVAAPLGPPVSQAVQDVLDRLTSVLRRTTDGISATLDKVLSPKR